MNRKRKKYHAVARRWWRREIRPLLILGLILFSIRSSLADWNVVPSGSMKPTILEGDRVFVDKLAYDLKVPFTTWHIAQWSNPQRGDIVVFFSPKDGTRLVKRVIGLPGDTVELRDDQLIINGQPVDYTAAGSDIPRTDFRDGTRPRHLCDGKTAGTYACGHGPQWSPGDAYFRACTGAGRALFYDG